MTADDGILRFYSDLSAWLDREVYSRADKLKWGEADISRAVYNYLFYVNMKRREEFINTPGRSINEVCITVPSSPPNHKSLVEKEAQSHSWARVIRHYAGRIVIYVDTVRQLEYMRPFILRLAESGRGTVILTQSSILPDFLRHPALTILPFHPIVTDAVRESGLYRISPKLAVYTHTIYCLINWLRPSLLLCCDGCQAQYMIAAAVCKSLGLPSACLQLGWPGFVHAGFRNLPYTYFLTWGAKFSEIFKRYSPKTEFHVTGRPGDIDQTGGHEAVTFFLQAPIFVSSEEYLIRMYGLVERVARRHPNIPVIMRPHPEIGISEREKKLERAFENVSIDICPSIEDVYRKTRVAVSHFSSCLVESIPFGCMPLMFNPTTGFEYPLLPLSCKSRSESEFMERLDKIINSSDFPITNEIQYYGAEATDRFELLLGFTKG